MEAEELVESRQYLSRIGVWPGPKRLHVEAWLGNFREGDDTAIAKALLESHTHLDESQIEYGVFSSIRALSSRSEFGPAESRSKAWREFIDNVTVSFPLGRAGDATASGYIFGRIASRLGFPENRILDTEHLVGALLKGQPRNVIILDDLAGTGTQFTRDWKRMYATPHGKSSLDTLSRAGKIPAAYFVPTVCTADAKKKIEDECDVVVAPTYLLESDYYLLDPNSRLVPGALRPLIGDFIDRYGPQYNGDEKTGFGDLGLALSFHHGCPNNTLSILQWGEPSESWKPLVRN